MEATTVSVITSCVWAVAIAVAIMYWRIKKMVDEVSLRIDNEMRSVYSRMDNDVRNTNEEFARTIGHIDSRADKLQSQIDKKNK
jgi:hypothetical protein